ncbi:DUF4189 domain-containing protein [Aggregatibacter actinomycetemcomitans]|nr:DUF4189 domain-containing protein [Aggregatibacter actinomycetemcomitans]
MKKLLFIVLGLTSFNVFANGCGGEYQPETGTCRIIDSSGREILYNIPPSQAGGTSSSKTIIYHDVVVPDKFGAFAYSEKAGRIEGVVNQNSLDEAKREALKLCRQNSRGASCKITKWIRNGCLAAAEGKRNGRYFLAQAGGAPGAAEQQALQDCKAGGATECRLLGPEACSLP